MRHSSIHIIKKVIHISENQYIINVYYPEYFMQGQPLTPFNTEIYRKINDYVQEFRKEAQNPELSFGQKFSLHGEYTSYTAKQRFITAKSDLFPYLGGAHPGHDMITTTFDTAKNSVITLSDFFNGNNYYLKRLSSLSEKALFSKYPDLGFAFHDPTFRKGFAPLEANFAHWALTDSGLIIFFPEYQIAPYAAGTLYIQIPYEAIKDL